LACLTDIITRENSVYSICIIAARVDNLPINMSAAGTLRSRPLVGHAAWLRLRGPITGVEALSLRIRVVGVIVCHMNYTDTSSENARTDAQTHRDTSAAAWCDLFFLHPLQHMSMSVAGLILYLRIRSLNGLFL
jgi:hypothetical protein